MHPKQVQLILINLVGGIAVLGSYALGILTHPNAGQLLWGDVPQSIRPLYTAGMIMAAAGYFAFIYFILFRLDPRGTWANGRSILGDFNAILAAILIPSALWMPLTFMAVGRSSPALVWIVRIVLVVVGAASISLFAALVKIKPRQPSWAYWIALIGSLAFFIQTAILDAIVWGSYFRG